jgi:hypothetical protein
LAIGPKSAPSGPVIENSGMNAQTMIVVEKKSARSISDDASMILSVSGRVRSASCAVICVLPHSKILPLDRRSKFVILTSLWHSRIGPTLWTRILPGSTLASTSRAHQNGSFMSMTLRTDDRIGSSYPSTVNNKSSEHVRRFIRSIEDFVAVRIEPISIPLPES